MFMTGSPPRSDGEVPVLLELRDKLLHAPAQIALVQSVKSLKSLLFGHVQLYSSIFDTLDDLLALVEPT